MRRLVTLSLLALASAGCATTQAEVQRPQGMAATGDRPHEVHAVAATDAPRRTVNADDPALWADPRDPRRARWFGTDKTDGLYVHDIDGRMLMHFAGDGPLNNVDLRSGFRVNGRDMVLVAATERRRMGIMTYLLDPDTLEVTRYGFIPSDMGEPYGFCMGRRGNDLYLIANNKSGEVRSYRVTAGPGGPVATLARTFRVGSQPEGCVVDEVADQLYTSEEDVGIWRISFDPAATDQPRLIAPVDGQRLTADAEGLGIIRDRGRTYLIASSQGDSTYPVWRVSGDDYAYVGRFAIEGGPFGVARVTDGVDAYSGPIGAYPEGAIAVHNEAGSPAGNQNFKLVDWRDVRRALGID